MQRKVTCSVAVAFCFIEQRFSSGGIWLFHGIDSGFADKETSIDYWTIVCRYSVNGIICSDT